MITADLNVFLYAAILPVLAIVVARIIRKKEGGAFTSPLSEAFKNAYKKRDHFAAPVSKKCPKCAEQLPLSALICDTCDFNFLAGAVTYRHKMLPAPEQPVPHEAAGQTLAYRT